VLRRDFSASYLSQFVRWIVLGALPGVIAWAALPFILAKFLGRLYKVGSAWDAFEYMFLCVFGPLFSPYPLVIVKEGQVDARFRALPQARPDGPGGPCRFVIQNDSAIIIERGGRRVAAVGPSSYVAGRFEKMQQIIDLRPQTNTTTASVITRDGIPVKVQVGMTFRIRWRGEPTAETPYPADPDALLQAAAAQAVVRPENGQPIPRNWADRVGGSLDGTLRNIVARYRLDELLEPRDPDARPRSDLERNYTEELKKSASGMGAEVTEVRVGAFEFDKVDSDIKRQWMDTWQSWWTGQTRVRQAQAEAGAIRTREMARAYAQLEMIGAITHEFQSVSGDESIPVNLVTLRFVEVISQMAANPESAIFLPHEALQTLDGVRKMLREAREVPELSHLAGELLASGAPSILPLSGSLANKRLLARLRVDREMELFGEAERNKLVQSIADHLQIPEQDIRLCYVITGSVLVTLEMPEHAALKLLKGYLDRDKLFEELAISQVELRPVLPLVTSAPQSLPQAAPKYLGAPTAETSAEPGATGQVDLIRLLRVLVDHFSEDELQDLCIFELLNIDYEILQVEGKNNKIRELISYCEHHGLLSDLERTVRRLRPNAFG
jgi:regulator of protease activity HflC (stomatin/prohibitin superfamily)